MIKDIVIPDIGENVTHGTVVAFMVKVGDTVAVDDPILELETDKAVVEIPSPAAGTITELLPGEGDEVAVGAVIARLDAGAATPVPAPSGPIDDALSEAAEAAPAPKPAPAEPVPQAPAAKPPPAPSAGPADAPAPPTVMEPAQDTRLPAPASPTVRRFARELGVDIYQVPGSGPGDRITKADIKAYVKAGRSTVPVATGLPMSGGPPMPDFGKWGPIEEQDLDTVRRLTAESTATSWQMVPHVTQFDEADVTALNAFVTANAKSVEKAGGKLTLTPIVTKVCAAALRRFPRFNASIDLARRKLIFKDYVHIGMAVDTPRGLLMPVIRDADKKSITELATAIVDLAGRARSKKVRPDELDGGTFSISNQGGIGGVGFTPIVLWPQVAILGMSRSSVVPKYIDGEFQPRTILPLSLSYDHRIIDGANAARFLRWICDSLAQPMTLYLD